jgi:hypothetical protein
MGKASRSREETRRADAANPVRSRARLAAVEVAAVMTERQRAATLSSLRRLPERRAALDARTAELVHQARALDVPWNVIGAALGVTPQAAQQRYGGSS